MGRFHEMMQLHHQHAILHDLTTGKDIAIESGEVQIHTPVHHAPCNDFNIDPSPIGIYGRTWLEFRTYSPIAVMNPFEVRADGHCFGPLFPLEPMLLSSYRRHRNAIEGRSGRPELHIDCWEHGSECRHKHKYIFFNDGEALVHELDYTLALHPHLLPWRDELTWMVDGLREQGEHPQWGIYHDWLLEHDAEMRAQMIRDEWAMGFRWEKTAASTMPSCL